MRKSLLNQLMKRLTIPLQSYRKFAGKLLITVPFMRRVMPGLSGVIIALLFSSTVSAVGMGGINVTSALGQPLKADIELMAIGKAEKDSLVARLASPEAYKNAGLEYPYGNRFKFQIENRADGQAYIKASSAQPVNDPFVSLLVELTWASGKLLREYTFLLDPPGYVSEPPAPAQVQVIAPETPALSQVQPAMPAVQATSAPLAVSSPVAAETPVPAPVEQPATAAEQVSPPAPAEPAASKQAVSAPLPAPAVANAESGKTATEPPLQTVAGRENKEWVAIHPGDTMYKIAEQYKLADMNVERMLVALYRANADQFEGRNMNRIKAGKILHLPSQQELTSVSLPDAVKEIHAQAADWNAYRQKLANAASASNQSQASQQVAAGKITSSIDTAPAKENAKEVLKLSRGEAPGDQAGAPGGKSLSPQDRKNAAREEAIATSKTLKEEQQRAALLEKNLQDMQRLAQLKAEAAAALTPPPPAASAAASAVKPAPAALPKQVKREPSLAEQIMEEPLYLAAVAGALLVLGGLGFMIYRRKRKKPATNMDFIQDVGSVSSRITAPVIPSPDTGDFTRSSAPPSAAAAVQPEHVDPISEADLFLNFGRDVQAEEILKEALHNTPGNHQISLKLLGIYANRKDTHSFSAIARQLQSSGDADAWQQAAVMGRKLDPGNPLYSGAGTIEDAGNATMQMTAFDMAPETKNVARPQTSPLDFDFDAGASSQHDGDRTLSADNGAVSHETEMDFDITSSGTAASGQESTMDFDITSTHPSMPAAGQSEATSPVAEELVFDVTSSQSFTSAETLPEAGDNSARLEGDGMMPFTLDFPLENVPQKSVPAPPSINLEDINLNFDEALSPPEPATGNKNDHDDQWQEVATKLDLAKAYHEMGDGSGAREILEEVMREGDAAQRETAQNLLKQLG